MMINFDVVASSSSGNCYIYNKDLMIDIGVSYSKIKDYLKSIKVILLTHAHSDHLNKKTLKKSLFEHPNIKIICGKWLVDILVQLGINKQNIWILQTEKKYDIGEYIIEPVIAVHDIPNCGYKIIIKNNNYKFFHISDTSTVKHIEAKDYDWASIEANYETAEELYKKIEKEHEEGIKYSHYERSLHTHLSQLDAINWLQKNNITNYRFIHEQKRKEKENDN